MSIMQSTLVLFAVFFVLLALSVPISISILISSFATAFISLPLDQVIFIIMQKMNTGIESFNLLAIPLFILAGNIMNNGGIARRLINFAEAFVGRIPGYLTQANALGNMFFGALSGSAVAAAAAIGGTINPIQEEEGYDKAFSTSVNIASAPTGLLIPPTTAFIVYSTVAGGVSISALFMAGYIPGILMGLSVMLIAYFYAKKHNYPVAKKTTIKEKLQSTIQAIPSILMIVIVVGGIIGGAFTATEGAGISVLYSFVLSLIYKSLTKENIKKILIDSARTSGIILFLISASTSMSWVMAYTGIPTAISTLLLSITTSPTIIFVLMLLTLLVVGTFMDITPALLIFTPIFLPIATDLGMDPVQFGIVIIFAMCIGTMTPPVGSVLFVSSGISQISIEEVTPKLIPYLIAQIIILFIVTFFPVFSMVLPNLMGLI